MYAAKSTNLCAYPHSLSYQATNLTNVYLCIIPALLSNIDVCSSPKKSEDTTSSSTYSTIPFNSPSAAFFIAAGLLIPGSELLIKNVGINPTRDGILRVCRQMGANLELLNTRTQCGEPVADILVKHSELNGTVIEGDLIPTLIDELPVIAVMAACANAETIVRNAEELKVKESNRLEIIVHHLSEMGCDITGTEDGMIIRGGKPLHGAVLDSHLDHRIAMSFAVAGLVADGETEITNADCVNISYP